MSRRAIDSGSKALGVYSELPYTVDAIALGGDTSPVVFRYAGQQWQTGDGSHQQSVGRYDGGKREMGMGFGC